MLESDLNRNLRGLMRKLWPSDSVIWERIENSAGIGTYDTFMAGPDGAGWIELKIAGPNAKPAMRPGQPAFGNRMLDGGVPAHVLCSTPSGNIKLISGRTFGHDWREHLVMRCGLRDRDAMRVLFVRCMTGK